jgi:hypothetical protein
VVVLIRVFPVEPIRRRSVKAVPLLVKNTKFELPFCEIAVPVVAVAFPSVNTIAPPAPTISLVKDTLALCPAERPISRLEPLDLTQFNASEISNSCVGELVPIPTFPLSNTTNELDAFVFCTVNAVVEDVAPVPFTLAVPLTSRRKPASVVVLIRTLPVLPFKINDVVFTAPFLFCLKIYFKGHV